MLMSYLENPKTKDSGIICCIPQTGTCPNNCEDCFFQSGRSYLEPIEENLPNMPTLEQAKNKIVRVNDGNDSNVGRDSVIACTRDYPNKFYNTALYRNDLEKFEAPVVLTLNPGDMTDREFWKIKDIPANLMFVRFRTNMWNLDLLDKAVEYYCGMIPLVITFMAYFNKEMPEGYKKYYVFRKRTLNSYNAITTSAWRQVMNRFVDTKYEAMVYSCGKIEGERGTTACARCGNCIREYYNTLTRMKK